MLPSGDVSVNHERISLLCPVTQARMQRPSRGSGCLHAAAFCATALRAISTDDGRYRCPICSSTFAEVEIMTDVPLTLFIADHPSAMACAVVRRNAASGGWSYRRAPARPAAPTHPKRKRTTDADAGPYETEALAAGSSWAARPVKVEVGGGAAGPSGYEASRTPKFVPMLPLAPVGSACDAFAPRGGGSAAARAAAEVRRHRAVHAAAQPSGAASAAAAAAAAATATDRSQCPHAFGSGSHRAHPDAATAPGIGGAAAPSKKAQRRRARREEAQRTQLLAKVKEELIRRALREDHPEDRGGCLWD